MSYIEQKLKKSKRFSILTFIAITACEIIALVKVITHGNDFLLLSLPKAGEPLQSVSTVGSLKLVYDHSTSQLIVEFILAIMHVILSLGMMSSLNILSTSVTKFTNIVRVMGLSIFLPPCDINSSTSCSTSEIKSESPRSRHT